MPTSLTRWSEFWPAASCEHPSHAYYAGSMTVESRLSEVERRLHELEIARQHHTGALGDLSQDIRGLKLDVREIRSRLDDVKADVVEVKQRIVAVEARMTGLEREVAQIGTNVQLILELLRANG